MMEIPRLVEVAWAKAEKEQDEQVRIERKIYFLRAMDKIRETITNALIQARED